jgi:threonyl-tRNA synthetase
MLVIGEREVNEEKISIRRQGKGDLGSKNVDEFIEIVKEEIKNKREAE